MRCCCLITYTIILIANLATCWLTFYGLVINNQSIGDALHFAEFEYVHVTIPYFFSNILSMIRCLRCVDGIIGVGPVDRNWHALP